MKTLISIFVLFISIFLWNILSTPDVIANNNTQTNERLNSILYVSNSLKEIYPQLSSESYTGPELNSLFYKLNSDSNKICNMVLNRYPKEQTFLNSFSPKLFDGSYNNILVKLIAGCHNFYKMNDINLKKVISKINNTFQETDRSCYSVGFSQIYLLASNIGCKSISIIDIDWRILWAHYQVVESLYYKKYVDFGLLHINWSADFSGEVKEHEPKISINTFCYAIDKPYCIESFEKFPTLGNKLLELQLGHLHEIKINRHKNHNLVFIYLSNALDPEYTTQKDFEELLNNLKFEMNYIQEVIILYHGGGNDQFALYKLKL
jgi:hypothetical protein